MRTRKKMLITDEIGPAIAYEFRRHLKRIRRSFPYNLLNRGEVLRHFRGAWSDAVTKLSMELEESDDGPQAEDSFQVHAVMMAVRASTVFKRVPPKVQKVTGVLDPYLFMDLVPGRQPHDIWVAFWTPQEVRNRWHAFEALDLPDCLFGALLQVGEREIEIGSMPAVKNHV